MVFSSIPFIYYFLPAALLLYFAVPGKYKNLMLLLTGILFYSWGEPMNMPVMLFSILCSYIGGLRIEKFRGTKKAKHSCVASVTVSLLLLFYFKYIDFSIENVNALFGTSLPLLHVALPIGISFYTFQNISYIIDVYRGEKPLKNFVDLAAYIAMFPQLIAGPIVRYSDIKDSLKKRTHSLELVSLGLRRFIFGLAKKVLIANQLGELCAAFKATKDPSVLFIWLYAIAFTLHVYFDFSGYSDMAIGLGKMFGFHFRENFDYPFISKSITEFWRRWHMSLGKWFRDYVYIPMGGNRCKKSRHYFNIFVVWFLTGFWHGAAWNFMVWGLYFAVLLVIEKTWLLPRLEKSRFLSRIYTLVLLVVSFVIFNASSMGAALVDLKGMLGFAGLPLVSAEALYLMRNDLVVLLVALVGATPIPSMIAKKADKDQRGHKLLMMAEPAVLLGLLIVITAFLVDGSFNPFLYFRF